MSFIQRVKELSAKEHELKVLHTKFESDRVREMSVLPETFGYSSLKDFINAVKKAVATSSKRKIKAKPARVKKGKKKRTRVKITPEIREAVLASVKQKISSDQIAKKLGISSQSVHNIKKAAGLVRKRA